MTGSGGTMPEIRVNAGTYLPGAEDPTAAAISFGDDATDALCRFVNELAGPHPGDGYHVQVTTEHGSFDARVESVTTDDRHIYAVEVRPYTLDSEGVEVFSDSTELVPFDRLRRLHVW
jgi:hypothetical protein